MKPKLHELTDRWAALLLVLVIVFWLFAGPLSQKADAVVVSSVIVGAVIATMALAGITFVASGMTAAQLQDWVSEKLNEWAADLGSPLDHLISSAGIGTTISGLLVIGKSAYDGISNFITWLKTELSLTDNSTTNVVQSGGILDFYTYSFSGSGSYSVSSNAVSIANSANNTIAQVTYSAINSYSAVQIDFSAIVHRPNYSTVVVFEVPSGAWISTSNLVNCSYNSGTLSCTLYGDYNASGLITLHNASRFMVRTSSYAAVQMDFNSILVDGSPVSDSSLDIDTGVITMPQVEEEEKLYLGVGALPGTTVDGVTEGVISDAVTNTLDVSGEVAESEPEYVIDGPEPVYGLADVFPFCIPFDLYDFVSCLAADPVAPHFEWRLYVEDLVDYTFVIDLQQFETVAQIFRTMFLLAFIIGLAMVTRHLLRS